MWLRRAIKILLVLVLLLIAAGSIAVWRAWDSPELGRMILSRISATTGMTIEAEHFRLSLREGLRLGNVHAVAELPGGRMVLDADTMLLEHRLGPLLERTIHVDRVVVERPRLVIEERHPGVADAPSAAGSAVGAEPPVTPGASTPGTDDTPSSAGAGFAAEVREIALVDATLESRPADAALPPTLVEGFDLTLRDLAVDDTRSPLTSVRGRGDLRVARIDAGGRQVADAVGTLHLGGGLLTVEDMSFDVVDGGRMRVPRFALQLDHEDLLFDVELRGALDVEGLLGVSERLVGGADLVFEGQGPLNDILSVAGSGRVEVQEGRLPAAKLFQLIDGVLGDSILVGAQHGLFDVAYQLRNQRVELEAFDIGTPNVGLTVSGEAGLDGTIEVLLEVKVPRALIKISEIPEPALDVLEDDQGRVRLPFRIGGASVDPSVVLARSAVLRAAREGAKREVRERAQDEIGKALRGLLSRRSGREGG